jgi:hypothetical protein
VKYVLLMYADPAQTKAMTAQDRATVARKHAALRTELINSGELLDGTGLAHPADTTTLRLEDGAVAITEGPLRASTLHLTAYYLITWLHDQSARHRYPHPGLPRHRGRGPASP